MGNEPIQTKKFLKKDTAEKKSWVEWNQAICWMWRNSVVAVKQLCQLSAYMPCDTPDLDMDTNK